MTSLRFENGHILTPSGTAAHLSVRDGRIHMDEERQAGEVIDLDGGYLMPGFIDTQVNGGGGVLFNDAPSVETLATMAAAHRKFGTTGMLPTLITDRLDVVDRAMRAVETAVAQGVPGILGIHLEGPFLSPQRKGIHDPSLFRVLDRDAKALLKGLTHGVTLVTLAPEQCHPDDIAELVGAGVIVAAGHTDATYDQTRAALAAGVTGFTHLFNAMSPFGHRAPGVVGAALENQAAWCGLIMDGHHVHPAALRVALSCRPRDRMMLVTDAMSTVGTDQTGFSLNGRPIRVENGVCFDEAGTLAGSALDMASAIRYAVREVGLSVTEAAIMASAAPAAFLGLDARLGQIAPGRAADLVWLDKALNVRGVWQDGVRQ
jgi:N-acetylglucosamine-6-phosphate deacetylase